MQISNYLRLKCLLHTEKKHSRLLKTFQDGIYVFIFHIIFVFLFLFYFYYDSVKGYESEENALTRDDFVCWANMINSSTQDIGSAKVINFSIQCILISFFMILHYVLVNPCFVHIRYAW